MVAGRIEKWAQVKLWRAKLVKGYDKRPNLHPAGAETIKGFLAGTIYMLERGLWRMDWRAKDLSEDTWNKWDKIQRKRSISKEPLLQVAEKYPKLG